MVSGAAACAHKAVGGVVPSECAVSEEGCPEVYARRYGEPQAFMLSPFWSGPDPVERAGNGGYLLNHATQDEARWTTGTYDQAGPLTICVSLPPLKSWRCQTGAVNAAGKAVGFGQDGSNSVDVAKDVAK